jgi:predicted CXXCH cytochrome family protein
MRWMVRFLRPNGTVKQEERPETTGRELRLGRGAGSHVRLEDIAVAFEHARIVVREADVLVEAVGDSVVLFDGVPASRGVLADDTTVGIGPYQIKLLKPDPGFDAGISVEALLPAAGEGTARLASPAALRLRGGVLGRRPLSWLLFLLVLGAGLALPLLAHFQERRAPVSLTGEQARPDEPAPRLAGLDHVWDSGPLSNPHKFLEERCDACHVRLFERVTNETCGRCHGDIRHHFDAARLQPADGVTPDLGPERCAGCHEEHQGAEGVIPTQQALCAGCHANLLAQVKTQLRNVSDFAKNAHNEFRPSVVLDARSETTKRIEIGAPELVEDSGLHFNHLCHLGLQRTRPDPLTLRPRCYTEDGTLRVIDWPELRREERARLEKEIAERGEAAVRIEGVLEAAFFKKGNQLTARLSCGSCHVADTGGANIKPVDMEQHCSYCHPIKFDPDDPTRVLPHGKPQEIVDILTVYYGAEAARGPAVRTDATRARQRPGAEPEPTRPVAQPQGPSPLELRLAGIFRNDGQSACGYCHETESRPEGERVKHDVLPVQVQRIWEPKARFDHGAHTNLACGRCHDAEKPKPEGLSTDHPPNTKVTLSTTSADVLLPPIAVCLECHRGEAASAAVPSTCTMCHVYHQERGTCPMVPSEDAAAPGGEPVCPAPQPRQAAAPAASGPD